MGIFHDEQNSVTLENSIFSAQSKIINSIRLAALPLAMAAAWFPNWSNAYWEQNKMFGAGEFVLERLQEKQVKKGWQERGKALIAKWN